MLVPIRLRQAMTLGGMSVRELMIRTWNRSNDHEIMTRASGVSFYAMLALVPFLGLVITLAVQLLPDITGQTPGETAIGNLSAEKLDSTLKALFPKEAYSVVHDQIGRLQQQERPSFLVLLFGLGVTVWLASSLFVAIIDAMNRINGVAETRSFLRVRITAIVMTCIEALILVSSLLVIVLWPQILGWIGLSWSAAFLATVGQWVVVYLMVLLSFALSFYVAPDAEQRWEWITPGSLVGTAVFLLSSFGFRLYVQHFSDYNKTYGSLGGVMVLLFWFWMSSLVLLTTAQMNKLIEDASSLGKSFGQKVDPTSLPDLASLKPEASLP